MGANSKMISKGEARLHEYCRLFTVGYLEKSDSSMLLGVTGMMVLFCIAAAMFIQTFYANTPKQVCLLQVSSMGKEVCL